MSYGAGRWDAPTRMALLLPTRGRPHNLERLHSAIQDTAARPDLVDIWCYLDDDDPAGVAAYEATGIPVFGYWVGPRRKLAASWNMLADIATRDDSVTYSHLLLWGDDVIPETPGWDEIFARQSAAHGPGIYYGQDGIWGGRPWPEHPEHLSLPTAVAMTTDVYRALGWIAPTDFGIVHLCIDLCWRDVAYEAGMLHYLPDVMIRHLHRCAGAPDDQTYRDANDDIDQKNADSLAYRRWRYSPRFPVEVERLKQLRAAWEMSQVNR